MTPFRPKRMPARVFPGTLPGEQKLKLNVPTLYGLAEQRGVLTRWFGGKWYLFEGTGGTEFTVNEGEVMQ